MAGILDFFKSECEFKLLYCDFRTYYVLIRLPLIPIRPIYVPSRIQLDSEEILLGCSTIIISMIRNGSYIGIVQVFRVLIGFHFHLKIGF